MEKKNEKKPEEIKQDEKPTVKKIYAARGLLEWQFVLKTSGAFIRICFSGGRMGASGVIPARYVTDNAVIQYLIENTPEYHSGKIYSLPISDSVKNENCS